jgi:Alginate export
MRTFWLLALFACLATVGVRAQQASGQPAALTSDYLNNELPQWLRFGGEFRSRLEGFTGGSFKPDTEDAYVLTRLRINMKIEPTHWLKFFAQGQDSRVFWKNQHPPAAPFQTTMNLRQAYVEIGDTEKKFIGLRVGRQELAFGEERLIGPSGWGNTPRYFEAVRLTLRHGPFRLDGFSASVIVVQDGTFNHAQPPNDLHGLYGGMDNIIPNSTIEPYVLWRLQRNQRTELGKPGNLDYKVGGVRWAGKVRTAFDYSIEVVREQGGLGTDSIGAWGGHWLSGHNFAQLRFKPRVFGEYNYASGDKNPRDGHRGTFDSIYPTAHDRWGMDDQIGWRNIHHLRGGVEARILPKVLLKGSYHSYWLASATDGLYAANGALVTRVIDGSAGPRVGQEIDIQAVWTIRPDIAVITGYGDLIPGSFLKKATPGVGYHYPFLQVTYTF